MYSEFVESLKRLYKARRISKVKIESLHAEKKITEQELIYILMEVG